jgi:uncharacterized protein (DUF1501 family)
MREAFFEEKQALAALSDPGAASNPSQRYLLDIARSANDASALVRKAWSSYRTPVDYGIADLGLRRVAAMIGAGLPARLYYTSYANNAFDTHVVQNDLHGRLLTYTSDAISGFMQDIERIGRADDVTLMIFSEFGRRVPENTSLGTDHGAANVMFVAGKKVKGRKLHALGKRQPVATVFFSGLKFQGRSSLRRSMVWPRQRRSMTAAM